MDWVPVTSIRSLKFVLESKDKIEAVANVQLWILKVYFLPVPVEHKCLWFWYPFLISILLISLFKELSMLPYELLTHN